MRDRINVKENFKKRGRVFNNTHFNIYGAYEIAKLAAFFVFKINVHIVIFRT